MFCAKLGENPISRVAFGLVDSRCVLESGVFAYRSRIQPNWLWFINERGDNI
jgi:hypothetical protein